MMLDPVPESNPSRRCKVPTEEARNAFPRAPPHVSDNADVSSQNSCITGMALRWRVLS